VGHNSPKIVALLGSEWVPAGKDQVFGRHNFMGRFQGQCIQISKAFQRDLDVVEGRDRW
jgi:hypothetical protein